MVLDHSNYKKVITDSSVLDVLMMKQEGNITSIDTFKNISSRKRMV